VALADSAFASDVDSDSDRAGAGVVAGIQPGDETTKAQS
jgi:hypothetical protein